MITDYLDALPSAWADTAKVFEAMGAPIRQRILLLFEPDEELTIKQISDLFAVSRTTINFHLKVLEDAGLLTRRRLGREALYRLERSVLLDSLQRVLDYARQDC
jgi:DNA-binding transcriptional ArsR family regulator